MKRKKIEKCKNCGGNIAVRNPTGKCDHLYYPENLPKKIEKLPLTYPVTIGTKSGKDWLGNECPDRKVMGELNVRKVDDEWWASYDAERMSGRLGVGKTKEEAEQKLLDYLNAKEDE